jgi:transposase
MEGRQRRSFTEDYKRQAAELVVSSGRSITSVAKELGLRDSVLRRWVDKPTSAAWRPTTQATPMAGGPGFGDRPAAPGERTIAHGAPTCAGPRQLFRKYSERLRLSPSRQAGHHRLGTMQRSKRRDAVDRTYRRACKA